MKKIFLPIYLILVFITSINVNAATITATKEGNWSDTTVWDLSRVPTDGDDVVLGGYAITWDSAQATIPASGILNTISDAGASGRIILALDSAFCNSGCALNVTTATCGTSTNGLIDVTGAGATTNTLTVTTGTGAGEGVIGGSASSACGLRNTSTGTVIVTNAIGGSAISAYGVRNNSSGAIIVTNAIGGSASSAHGVTNNSIGTVIVTNATGGSATTAHGVNNSSTGTVIVTNATGGSATTAHGVNNSSTGTVSVSGNITGGTGLSATGIYNATTGQVTLSGTVTLTQGIKGAAYEGYAPAWNLTTGYAKFYTGASFGQAANTNFYPSSYLPTAKYVYYTQKIGDASTQGTLKASTISEAAGSGSNLSPDILKSGEIVDDVTGTMSSGGGACAY